MMQAVKHEVSLLYKLKLFHNELGLNL